ncbi:MAG: bacteriohopanetetrol glucosamine biosynthesis glycosyltransferase HpnI [Acidobacteria bacterium]|nr:bacteriohopanetetrol glucosamine biosynthesis glycosyltransferase HpnI [Acidobacteriota bacterium]
MRVFVFTRLFLYNSGLRILTGIVAATTGASLLYCALSIWAAARFLRRPLASASRDLPPVSILKPLKGTDPEMYESFRSHCLQQYPAYEIVFGVGGADDPAAPLVRRLELEFPHRPIRLVLCPERLGANGKISSLIQLARAARHEVLLVNDSDVRVAPDYLRTVATELESPRTGLVTCLYRGVPAKTIGSRLESLAISTDFVPGVLVAREIEGGLRFALGSTLAFRRRQLDSIGGFEAIADYLADDYELGKRIRDQGLKIELSTALVETFLPAYGFSGFFAHQLRWARTIRASRPAGYMGLAITYTLAWAILCLLVARGAAWAWYLLAAALSLRLAAAVASGLAAAGDREVLRSLLLLPLRDLVAPFIWAAGLVGQRIVWRGEKFDLSGGKIKPLV